MHDTAPAIRQAVDFTFDLAKLRSPVLGDWKGAYAVPETLAERAFRAAHIALALAVQENMDSPTDAVWPLLFRDLHRVTSVGWGQSEARQPSGSGESVEAPHEGVTLDVLLRDLWGRSGDTASAVGRIANDAYALAELFSLREQQLQGNALASSRISELGRTLQTDSARDLAAAALEVSPHRHWGEFANCKDLQHLADYIYEIGQLRLTPRTGWHFLRIRHESVAEHCYRAAQMAFLVSILDESSDPDSVNVEPSDLAAHLLVHDNPEIRTGDPNSVAKHYVKSDERLALLHQTSAIGTMGSLVSSMWYAVETQETAVGRVAKDFDRLEMLVTAKTLIAARIRGAESWIENTRPLIKTNIGKKVLAYIDETT